MCKDVSMVVHTQYLSPQTGVHRPLQKHTHPPLPEPARSLLFTSVLPGYQKKLLPLGTLNFPLTKKKICQATLCPKSLLNVALLATHTLCFVSPQGWKLKTDAPGPPLPH